MPECYKRNHYVPVWYQKRFLPKNQHIQYYLNIIPETRVNNGHRYTEKALSTKAPKNCFVEDDLYTTQWGDHKNREIEELFFGDIDRRAPSALKCIANYSIDSEVDHKLHEAFRGLIFYMSIQKLRTPNALEYIRKVLNENNKNMSLKDMQIMRDMFCGIWVESIWQIADASQSPTKFIISDHPVIAYNHSCYPKSEWCTSFNDPDINMTGTHTYFPLSSEKIFILTNRSWVLDPYQNSKKPIPITGYYREKVKHNISDIQRRIFLEEEVIEINFITKRSAFKHIAAQREEWLYPEEQLCSTDWHRLGGGYLLMPDPRYVKEINEQESGTKKI